MPAVTGINVLIQVEDSGNPGTYISVGGQRNLTLNLSMNIADATNKTSGGWAENLPTFRSWSIDFDGVYIVGDSAIGELETAYFNNTQINVRMADGTNTYTGLASIADMSREGPYDDVYSISGTFQGSGVLTKA